ncbi:DUF2510 domain-containing protein [Mycobacterium sp. 48b]|uniref:DUF2510 domain-containing protein n=1 Tax=Mycobacterium sp. 48b TaxID=3400426 RepID=UPI003AB04A69
MPPPAQAGWFTDPWNVQQIRYFDGRYWTAHVAAGSPPQPVTLTPCPTPPLSAAGYPFGEPTLFLRPVGSGSPSDLRCSVTNTQGEALALIKPLGELPLVGRELSNLAFEVVRPNGVQLLQFNRSTGTVGLTGHRVEVHDPEGREAGCLRQTSSYWSYFRTARMSVNLEYQHQVLGSTKIRTHIPPFTTLELDAAINDANGAEIGRVRSQPNQSSITRKLTKATFDYRLDCSHPTSPPISSLMLVTAFAHFLYDRLTSVAPLSRWSQ